MPYCDLIVGGESSPLQQPSRNTLAAGPVPDVTTPHVGRVVRQSPAPDLRRYVGAAGNVQRRSITHLSGQQRTATITEVLAICLHVEVTETVLQCVDYVAEIVGRTV